jgi:hypothetical protein
VNDDRALLLICREACRDIPGARRTFAFRKTFRHLGTAAFSEAVGQTRAVARRADTRAEQTLALHARKMGENMLIRGIGGVILCLLGATWIAQGTGGMSGSSMSGHGQYAVLGVVVALVGIYLLVQAWRVRGRRTHERP